MSIALANAIVLTPTGWREDLAVLLDDGRIAALLAHDDPRIRQAARFDCAGRRLLPGFVDAQVNGGGGVLFNDAPTVDTIAAIGAAHRRFGTTGFLPTLISDDLDVVATAIAAVGDAIAAGVPGVLGIHVEGPFISQARRGAHDAAHLRALERAHVELLASLRGGRTLVTLAPERASLDSLRALADAGVVVAAGHTNAGHAALRDALAAGVRGFTHLFNAMSPLQAREPGAVGTALHDQDSWCSIIVDGWHAHPVSLQVALAAKRHARFLLVTDAMPCVGTTLGHFPLQGRRIEVSDGRCVDEHGTLSGSALDMAAAVRNAVRMLGLPLDTAARMASAHPAEFLRLDDRLGQVMPGLRADLVLLDDALQVTDTWIGGAHEAHAHA